MSNIIAFCQRAKSARDTQAVEAGRAIGSAASELDGATFAHAAEMGWLADDLRVIAARLETSLRSLGPELSAADIGLPLPFVTGFAGHQARPMHPLTRMPPLAVQQTLTPSGFEDTFYWADQRT